MLSRRRLAIGIYFLHAVVAWTPRAAGAIPVTLYVDRNAPGIVQDGMGWSTAFLRLEDAITVAIPHKTQIRVAKGTYRPDNGTGDRTRTFHLNTGVVIRGGYAGYGMTNPNLRDPILFPTILNGDIGITGEAADNSYHVVTALGTGEGAVLNGVTVRDGNANGAFPNNRGGGVTIPNGQHRFEDCRFSFNSGGFGGGSDMGAAADAIFVNCIFSSNIATNNGGAVYTSGSSPTFINCTFLDNSADLSGGAVSINGGDALLIDCSFSNNAGMIFGGAFHNSSAVSTLINCVFTSNFMLNNLNVVYDGGGGLYNHNGAVMVYQSSFLGNVTGDDGAGLFNRNGSMLLERCILRGNWSADRGGAIYSYGGDLELRSCSVHANVAAFSAGGLYLVDGDNVVNRSTFVGNRSNGSAGGILTSGGSLSVNSTIFWNNSDTTGSSEPAQLKWLSGLLSVNYTCMAGWTGVFGGVGNLGSWPAFANVDGPDGVPGTADDDLRLAPNSLCINAGIPSLSSPPEVVDLDGQPRVMGCRVDMGAFEFVTGPAGTGDMNNSGSIDGLDIQGFTQALLGVGPPAYLCVADLNADQFVDSLDLAIFITLILP